MAKAKAVNVCVRPIQSVDLCYPISGIIGYQPDNLLGSLVKGVNREAIFETLNPEVSLPTKFELLMPQPEPKTKPTVKPKGKIGQAVNIGPSLFDRDSPTADGPDQIDNKVGQFALSRLQAEDIAVDLTQTIGWHRLQYESNQTDELFRKRQELLGEFPRDPKSITALIRKLSKRLKDRQDQMLQNYWDRGLGGVLEEPKSTSSYQSDTSGAQSLKTNASTSTTYHNQELRFPYADEEIRYLRSEISLRQEELAAYRMNSTDSYSSLRVERSMTAAEVRRVQIAYIDTFLFAPFDGLVTSVFRNAGDAVVAGQPVLRVENDKSVYLVGTIKCRSLIRLGDQAEITTTLFGAPGSGDVQIDGTVCAIRGHESLDEQWNVIIRCDNENDTGRVLPLNYSFDLDATIIDITHP